jgi:hypothetical protein
VWYKTNVISSKKDTKMRIAAIWMVLVLGTGPYVVDNALAGGEVYRWVDENGVVHFGDQPDAAANAEVIEIKKSPTGPGQAPAAATAEAGSNADDAKSSYAQTLREERAAKRKEAAAQQKTIDDNCRRSREVVSQLEPSPRVNVTHEDGSVTRMDDNERLRVLNEAKAYISENCEN